MSSSYSAQQSPSSCKTFKNLQFASLQSTVATSRLEFAIVVGNLP
jgi:hypothetical protein